MSRGAAAASRPAAAAAASAALEAGSSAVDAIVAGFFGDAGADAGVLLAPAVAIVAGYGAGARAFDGRAVQPGKGAARPRGFLSNAPIPDGARVAVPRGVAMLLLLHSYHGRTSCSSLVRAGVVAAENAAAKARAALIRRIGSAGVLALRSSEVVRELLDVGGPVAGGTLTAADLEETLPAETAATVTALPTDGSVVTPPWATDTIEPFAREAHGGAEVIVAVDGRGVAAALSYLPARNGVYVEALEIAFGRDGVPVRRGVTRTPPGTLLGAPAPVAIVSRAGGFNVAVGLRGQLAVDPLALEDLVTGLAIEQALSVLCRSAGASSAIAAVGDGRRERAVSTLEPT